MPEVRGLYGLPPGADFPAELVRGLLHRFADAPPDALARVEVIVNTRRMQRRVRDLFADGTPRLLPRLRLVTDLAIDPGGPVVAPVPSLRRQLELTRLVGAFLDRDPTMGPRSNAFALSESLVALLSEMEDEGVSPAELAALDVGDLSAHWDRSRSFLAIVQDYLGGRPEQSEAAALRAAVLRRVASWQEAPPDHPVIVAGSTGSRGTTQLLMQAVARLPSGAVVLPGFDFDQPGSIWMRLGADSLLEDHPQYRFAVLMAGLGQRPADVRRWTDADPVRDRNAVVSLALRPAPVTDQWLEEGGRLPDLRAALSGISLIEASDPRHEALSIALCLRKAVAQGKRSALITPDRNLARRVSAELDRWRIAPDDSAGRPLSLSAPGRFLRQVARLAGRPAEPAALLALLKHPLCHSAGDRGEHLRRTRMLELDLRRAGLPTVGLAAVTDWAARRSEATHAWALWLTGVLGPLADPGARGLDEHVARHLSVSEALAQGAEGTGSGALWLEEAGRQAMTEMSRLAAEAEIGSDMNPGEYAALIDRLLSAAEVREAAAVDPRVMIWGTLEARVQGADLVVLGGLNDGIWPPLPGPDPWLNRRMRREAGLLSPERRVGLSAHDFQQAAAAPEVVFSRALRDDETETVMSRWLNRLFNLVQGLPARHGPAAWEEMQARGAQWTALARQLDADVPRLVPHPRPAPCPPVAVRPSTLSVTEIQTLIRDPYAIYARRILGLRPLDPLTPQADARLRGTVLHKVFERFVKACPNPGTEEARTLLLNIAEAVLAERVPWPEVRILWSAQIARAADWFLRTEVERRAKGTPVALEAWAEMALGTPDFILRGKIDRIDLLDDGRLAIFDYKTGTPPSGKQIKLFDRQLILEAAMAEHGRVEGLDPAEVAEVAHIGLGTSPVVSAHKMRDEAAKVRFDPDVELADLRRLIAAYGQPTQGYASRRAMEKLGYDGDFDHLARYGEWDESDPPRPEIVP